MSIPKLLPLPVEIEVARDDEAAEFLKRTQREALSTLYGFPVIWHEQEHAFVARSGEAIVGAARLRVVASLGYVEAITVAPDQRRKGIGRLLLERCEEVANYYNCHKVTVAVMHDGAAQQFFTSCGYKLDAVLPQHTFKLDVALLRKFLL